MSETKKFEVVKISSEDVDLTSFVTFKEQCKAGGVSGTYARELSRQAAILADDMANWKAMLDYSATESEREAKKQYAVVLNGTTGTQVVRESAAKMDEEYNRLLDETAKLSSTLWRIRDGIDFAKMMHYYFKAIADTDGSLPHGTDYAKPYGGEQ